MANVAITECFGSMVAQVVKVSRRQDNKITIDKVFALMDCGWYAIFDLTGKRIRKLPFKLEEV